MAIPKRGSRRIEVAGIFYRWKVSQEPDWDRNPLQALKAVVALESGGPTLVVDFGAPRPDWNREQVTLPDGTSYERIVPYAIVTPRRIAEAIRQARLKGWQPEKGGGTITVTLEPEG
jgi:hypothetical protein